MFLAEFDLTNNRVTADKFCSIYSYLASRPPTPAAKDAPVRPAITMATIKDSSMSLFPVRLKCG